MLLLGAVAVLTGCRREARPGDPVEIRFWAMGREGEVVGELMPWFERENPGIRVRVQLIPWSAAHEKMITAYVGDAVPDLGQVGNTWIPEFAALGALDTLTLASLAVPDSGFFPGILATNVVDGGLYGVPWYVDTRLVFYNRDALRRAGLDAFPTTWAGWTAAMRAMQTRGGVRYGALVPPNEWNVPVLLALQNGATLLRDGGRYGAFDAPEFREALRFYLSLYRDGLAPVNAATLAPNVHQAFAGRVFGTYITGPWQLGEFRTRLPDSLQQAWATAPMPGPDGPGASLAGGSSLVLFRSARHKAEAAKLMAFLVRADVQREFYRRTGSLPARREVWADTALTRDPRLAAFGDQLERVVPTPLVPEWERIAQKIAEVGETAVRGAITEDEAVRRLNAEVDAMLAKRRRLLDLRRPAEASPAPTR